MKTRLLDLLAMSRFANLPTVWSNVLLGILLTPAGFQVSVFLSAALAISLLYLGGCFLNDAHDIDFDAKTRPDRPIPAGRFRQKSILQLALLLCALGMGVVATAGMWALLFASLLFLSIVLYTLWHKKHPASLIFMALSRALIYPTVFLMGTEPELAFCAAPLLPAALMASYIMGISLTAKGEVIRDRSPWPQRWGLFFLILPALIYLSAWGAPLGPVLLLGLLLSFAITLITCKKEIGKGVSVLLAGIPLTDFLSLSILLHQGLPLSLPSVTPAFDFFSLLPLFFLPLSLTGLSLLLQRLAPAT